ncbi:139aa long hypothetical protein [Pyrococcus horikoshii OT3]|uniref:Uncharacterized protein n=1 Tax=Pyrococcus horikoshii (strain ATCC 700860 / DSM 12428 / JCM 9974 / NBRC 100139 / OT-3) TaxID=70601 RepID=O58508_PYRHO|nr:139aa long hypothetical protein [Pyrococcus horikoshii OT3]
MEHLSYNLVLYFYVWIFLLKEFYHSLVIFHFSFSSTPTCKSNEYLILYHCLSFRLSYSFSRLSWCWRLSPSWGLCWTCLRCSSTYASCSYCGQNQGKDQKPNQEGLSHFTHLMTMDGRSLKIYTNVLLYKFCYLSIKYI